MIEDLDLINFGLTKDGRDRLFGPEGLECMKSLSEEGQHSFAALCSDPEFKEVEILKPLIESLL